MAPSLRNNRDFGTSRLAALKEITPIHTIAEVRKAFGLVALVNQIIEAFGQ